MTAGFEKRLSELPKPEAKPESKPEEKPEGKDVAPTPAELELRKQIEAQNKKLTELEEQATSAKNKALLASLRSDLDRVSNGKLATNAEELIKKEFLGLAKIDLKKEAASFEIDGKTYGTVGEAFETWLGLDAHKGYRAPPPGTQVQTTVQPHVFHGSHTQQDDFSAALDEARVEL